MDIKVGQKRQWNESGNIYTVLESVYSPYKVLWKVLYKNGETKTHEEHIMLSLSSLYIL